MADKYANAQAMSQGIAKAFGDDGPEAQARKRKMAEDASAQEQAAQTTGQTPSAWDTMKSMGGDLVAGAKDMSANPSEVYDTITGKKKK